MSEAALFDSLIEEFYPVWFRYHPEQALAAGVHGYERLLPAQDDDDAGAMAAWLESLIVALEELDFDRLDAERRLDLRLMFDEAQAEYEALLERDWRHHDPLRFLPRLEISQLACAAERGDGAGLANLIRSIPEYLRHASAQLLALAELLSPVLVTATAAAARDEAGYLGELAGGSWLRARFPQSGEIETLCDGAAEALRGFADLLQREVVPVARGPLGCGGRQWRFLSCKRHALQLHEGDLRSFLTREASAAEAELRRAAEACGVPATAEGVGEVLSADVPVGEDARVRAYRDACERYRAWAGRSGVVPLPEAPIRVQLLTACPAPPGWRIGYRADPQAGEGVIVLAQGSRGEGRVRIRDDCLEHGSAGAHLLAFAGGAVGQRLPRRLSAKQTLAGGWGLYLRQRLIAEAQTSDAERLVFLWRRWRQLRLAELDLALHLDGLETERVAARLAELEPDQALRASLLVDLARHPTDRVAEVVGWGLIEGARSVYMDSIDGDPAAFHRRLFSAGALPVPLILDQVFGTEFWGRVSEGLLR